MLLRYKFQARPNFVCQTQSDGEEEIPRSILHHPDYLGPDLLTRGGLDGFPDGMPGSVSASSETGSGSSVDPSSKVTSAEWLSRIKRRTKAKQANILYQRDNISLY